MASDQHPSEESMQTAAEVIDRVLDDDATDDERDELTDIWSDWDCEADDPPAPTWANSVYPYQKADSDKDWKEVTPRDTDKPLLQRIRAPESDFCDLEGWR